MFPSINCLGHGVLSQQQKRSQHRRDQGRHFGDGTDLLAPERFVGALQAALGKDISGLGIECAKAGRHIWGVAFCLMRGERAEEWLHRGFLRIF